MARRIRLAGRCDRECAHSQSKGQRSKVWSRAYAITVSHTPSMSFRTSSFQNLICETLVPLGWYCGSHHISNPHAGSRRFRRSALHGRKLACGCTPSNTPHPPSLRSGTFSHKGRRPGCLGASSIDGWPATSPYSTFSASSISFTHRVPVAGGAGDAERAVDHRRQLRRAETLGRVEIEHLAFHHDRLVARRPRRQRFDCFLLRRAVEHEGVQRTSACRPLAETGSA